MNDATAEKLVEQQGQILLVLEKLVSHFDADKKDDETPSMMDVLDEVLTKHLNPLTARIDKIEQVLDIKNKEENMNGNDLPADLMPADDITEEYNPESGSEDNDDEETITE